MSRVVNRSSPREVRLLMCDCVQRDGRIGDDPRAIIARDLLVHVRTVCGLDPFAFAFDALRRCSDLALRFQRNTLCLNAAMINVRVDAEFRQPFVDMLGPTFDHLRAVPVANLRAEAVLAHRPHGEHDMGVGFGHAVLADVPMHIEVGDHALVDKFGLREVAGQLDALRLTYLAWNGELHLAGKLERADSDGAERTGTRSLFEPEGDVSLTARRPHQDPGLGQVRPSYNLCAWKIRSSAGPRSATAPRCLRSHVERFRCL